MSRIPTAPVGKSLFYRYLQENSDAGRDSRPAAPANGLATANANEAYTKLCESIDRSVADMAKMLELVKETQSSVITLTETFIEQARREKAAIHKEREDLKRQIEALREGAARQGNEVKVLSERRKVLVAEVAALEQQRSSIASALRNSLAIVQELQESLADVQIDPDDSSNQEASSDENQSSQ